MKKIGEPIVITVDKERHLMQEVEEWKDHIREVCIVNECGVVRRAFAVDLGPVNEDGWLPSPWDSTIYPLILIISQAKDGQPTLVVVEFTMDGQRITFGFFRTVEEAKDAWNRRVM